MALRLAETEPQEYEYVYTPTGDEPLEMIAHWEKLGQLLGRDLKPITNGKTLNQLIHIQKALPNVWMRWCTRMLKIEPFEEYIKDNMPCTVYVGIRSDEMSRDGVDYSSLGKIVRDFPLVRWGWELGHVLDYLNRRQVTIPERTDCEKCFFQTLYEWWALWKFKPESFAQGEEWESLTGHTLRSPQRDSHPAALKDLRREFEAGYIPKRKLMKDRPRMCSICAR